MSDGKSSSPLIPSRGDIIAKDKMRKLARRQLREGGDVAKGQLAPSFLFGRWKGRQQRKAAAMLDKGKKAALKNAPIIGIAAAAAVLYAARKPISNAIQNYRQKPKN